MVAILDSLHIYYYEEFYYLSTEFWVIARLIESIVILLFVVNLKKLKFNKWIGLTGTIFIVYILSKLIITINSNIVSNGMSNIISPFRIVYSLVILLILFFSIIKLKKEINNKDQITYNYVYLALCFAFITHILFITFIDKDSYMNLFMHILKVVYYLLLFNGIFVSTIRFPYDKLEDERSYMDKILNSLPIGITTYNENLKLLFANNKGKELLGCESNGDIESSMENLIEKFCGSRKTDKNLIRLAVEKSKSIRDKMITVRNFEKSSIKIIVNVLKLDDKGYICMFDEAKKEQELENLKLQTQTILNCLSNTVLILDNNKRIIMCNNAFEEVYEIKFSDIIGITLDEFNEMFKLDKREIKDDTKKADDMYEATIKTLKGNKKELIIQPAHIYNVDGEVIGDISVGSDITDLKKENEKMLHKDKLALLGQMSAAIVHESKNLLASIKGYCQLIILKEQDLQIKKYVSRIDSMTDDVNRVMIDFLDMAKPRAPILKETSLNDLIKSMEFMLSSSSLIKGIDISILLSPVERVVMTDEAQLKQVILNMVKNSIEAMNKTENPVLLIKTGQNEADSEMYIGISDNGKGISEEEKKKIGSPFFTTKKNGTGLGLNVCYQIIKEHNGRIDLISEVGKGTTFNIVLPATEKTNLDNEIEEDDYINDSIG
jgi:signal transduction histidine kinase